MNEQIDTQVTDATTNSVPSVNDQATESQNKPDSKYSRYYEINGNEDKPAKAGTKAGNEFGKPKVEKSTSGDGTQSKAGDSSAPTKEPEQKQAREKIPDWQRRINTLTAREKAQAEKHAKEIDDMRTKYEELSAKVSAKEKPKLERKNFANDEEWIDHVATEKANKFIEKRLNERDKLELEHAQKQEEQQRFQSSWDERLKANYPNPELVSEFTELVNSTPDNLHQDIHDFVRYSQVGPRMLHAMLLRPDYLQELNRLPSSVRTARLAQLEDAVYGVIESENKETQKLNSPSAPTVPAVPKKTVSNAPDPIGRVGVSGSSTSLDEQDSQAAVLAYKRKRFGR